MKALIDTVNNRIVLVQASFFDVKPPLKWIDCAKDVTAAGYLYVDGKLVLNPNAVPAAWYVLKATIRSRLGTKAGVLDELPAWWGDAPAIHSNDPQMLAVLERVQSDPSVVLARDPVAARMFGLPIK